LSDVPTVLKLRGPLRVHSSVDQIPSLEANRFEVQTVLFLRIRVLCDVTL